MAVGTFTLATQSKPYASILIMRKIRVILGVGAVGGGGLMLSDDEKNLYLSRG